LAAFKRSDLIWTKSGALGQGLSKIRSGGPRACLRVDEQQGKQRAKYRRPSMQRAELKIWKTSGC